MEGGGGELCLYVRGLIRTQRNIVEEVISGVGHVKDDVILLRQELTSSTIFSYLNLFRQGFFGLSGRDRG